VRPLKTPACGPLDSTYQCVFVYQIELSLKYGRSCSQFVRPTRPIPQGLNYFGCLPRVPSLCVWSDDLFHALHITQARVGGFGASFRHLFCRTSSPPSAVSNCILTRPEPGPETHRWKPFFNSPLQSHPSYFSRPYSTFP
jgi:hypothetical protein